jgi:DNA repair exonuclease SbcCD ATPase subunit
MDLDEAVDQLYAGTPDDFMARRTALAAEAKESGDKALAKQITGLRKPTRSAWLVNLVARAEPNQVAELRELGPALQQAQQQMAGDELRRLSRQRRTMIDSLARRAAELGAEHGYDPPDSAVQEVSQTLQAALADPAVADVVLAGRLHQAVTYGGFGPDDLAPALAASVPATTPDSGRREAETKKEPDEAESRAAAAEKVKQAREEADAARAAAEEAEAAAEEATAHADELADQVESLRSRLREAETAEREAREAARAARKRSAELRRVAAAAEQAAARAEQA